MRFFMIGLLTAFGIATGLMDFIYLACVASGLILLVTIWIAFQPALTTFSKSLSAQD